MEKFQAFLKTCKNTKKSAADFNCSNIKRTNLHKKVSVKEEFKPELEATTKAKVELTDHVDITWEDGPTEVDRVLAVAEKDHTVYKVLKLPLNASEKLAKNHFRILSKLIHPDKCKAENSAKAFDIVKNAINNFEELTLENYNESIYNEALSRLKQHLLETKSQDTCLTSKANKAKLNELQEKILEEREERLLYAEKTRLSNIKKLQEDFQRQAFESFMRNAEHQTMKLHFEERKQEWIKFKGVKNRKI